MLIRCKADLGTPLNGNLVIQLQFVRTKCLRQFQYCRRIGIIIGQTPWNHLCQRHAMQQRGKILQG